MGRHMLRAGNGRAAVAALVVAGWLIMAALPPSAAAAQETPEPGEGGVGMGRVLFVSPDGSDASPGTQAAPFASLSKARDTIRGMDRATPITVFVGPGRYQLAETLTFDHRDSGTPVAPIRYRALGAPGSARLTGGIPVTG